MCLGVPMKIVELDYPVGVAEAKGVRRTVYLQLLPPEEVSVGDYVIVHVGFAIKKLSPAEAEESWRLLEEALDA